MAFEGQYLSHDDKMDVSKMLGDQDLNCNSEALNESAMMFDGVVLYLHRLCIPLLYSIQDTYNANIANYWWNRSIARHLHLIPLSPVPRLDTDSHSRTLCWRDRLGQPFEFKKITSDRGVAAQVNETTSICNMMDIKTLGVLSLYEVF
ncbi:hypothetical protein P692DRAFT_20582226 [Suillus brevipes Sb2]|jgi:hypothetical protein|nr:hypothetical protein P692DRAFT_20582226 [Suillus brevipes Sb2]